MARRAVRSLLPQVAKGEWSPVAEYVFLDDDIAAQIVIVREATNDTYSRSFVPGLTVEQFCRLRRAAADQARTAATLERLLSPRQAKPAPFFGTVEADAVDIAALDAVWSNKPSDERPTRPDPTEPRPDDQAAPDPGPASANQAALAQTVGSKPTPDQPGAAPPTQHAEPSPTAIPVVAGASPGSPLTRLDPGPGRTRDVPHLTGRAAAGGAAPAHAA